MRKVLVLILIIYHTLTQRYLVKPKTRNDLIRRQNKNLKKFLRRLKKKSPFYKSFYFDETNWRDVLPPMDKAEHMKHLGELNCLGLSKKEILDFALEQEKAKDYSKKLKNVTVGLSSGTSGHRGVFLCTDLELSKYMGMMLAKAHPGPLLKRQRVALFLRANSNLYSSGKGLLMSFRYFSIFESLDSQLSDLQKLNPTLLIAPPSVLREIAKKIMAGEIDLRCERIFSAAEVLDPIDEIFLQKAFEQKILQIYQCTEGFLGISCSQGSIHLNEENLIIDKYYVNQEKNKFMPIVTDYMRLAEPIVRYRLNDILTEGAPCPCGLPTTTIASIDGRQDDVLYFSKLGADGFQEIYPDFLRRCVLLTEGKVEDYRILQKAPDLLEVQLKPLNPLFFDNLKLEIENLIREKNCRIPKILMAQLTELEPGQKKRRVQGLNQ